MASEDTLVARFAARAQEIQWRGVQRDAVVVFAFLLCGAMLGAGVWTIVAPVPLMYLAFIWFRHDKRIGMNAKYLRVVLEPVMRLRDNTLGWEEFLDKEERNESHRNPLHFSFVTSRLLFPTLQGVMLLAGVYRYIQSGVFNWASVLAVVVAILVGLGVTAFTFFKVKHVR